MSIEPTNEVKKRTVRMDDDTWDALTKLAAENGRNVADEVRVACVEHLAKNDLDLDAPLVVARGRRGDGRVPKSRNKGEQE